MLVFKIMVTLRRRRRRGGKGYFFISHRSERRKKCNVFCCFTGMSAYIPKRFFLCKYFFLLFGWVASCIRSPTQKVLALSLWVLTTLNSSVPRHQLSMLLGWEESKYWIYLFCLSITENRTFFKMGCIEQLLSWRALTCLRESAC